MKSSYKTFSKIFGFALVLTMIFNTGLFAQKYVKTTVEKRNVVLEEFTGIHCQFCPDGHRIANELVAKYPGKVFLVNVHAGIYATPGTGEPDLRTGEGTAIDAKSGLQGYPAGSVNRNKTPWASNRGNWEGEAKAIMNENSPVNVAVKSSVDLKTGVVTTEVEAYFTSDVTTPQYVTIFLVQDEIMGPQVDGGNYNPTNWVNGLYKHNHTLRLAITPGAGTAAGAWGEAIPTTTAGTLFTKTYTTQLPANIAKVAMEAHKLDVVAFVGEYQGKIWSGAGEKVTFDVNDFVDLALTDKTVYPTALNSTSLNPKFEVTNNGKTVSQFTLSISINGVKTSKTYTGSLANGAKTTIDFGNVTFVPNGTNLLQISDIENINGAGLKDMATANNNINALFVSFKEKAFTSYTATFENMTLPSNFALDISQNPKAGLYSSTSAVGANNSKGMVQFYIHSSWNVAGKPAYLTFGEADLTNATKEKLSFMYAYSDGTLGGTAPVVKTQASIDFGKTWVDVASTTLQSTATGNSSQLYIPTSAQYKQAIIDISSYYGKTAMFRLAFIPGTSGNAAYIDDIVVGAVSVGPECSVTSLMNFGTCGTKTVKEIEISNTGDKDFSIYSGSISNDLASVFMTEEAIFGVVKAGETKKFKLSFTPKDNKTYNAKLTISTSITAAPDYTVVLTGIGNTTSVEENLNDLVTMSVGPNPVVASSTLNYTVGGTTPRFVEINLIDAAGKTVANLVNSTLAPGAYNTTINTDNLSSGTYYVVSNINGTQIPVAIVK